MSYTFAYSLEEDLLKIHLAGTRPALEVEMVEQHWEPFEKVSELCRRNGIRRLLYINDVPGRMNNSVAEALFGWIGDFGLDRDVRIAVAVSEPRNQPIVEFGSRVAIANGWNIRVFGTEEEARTWLKAR